MKSTRLFLFSLVFAIAITFPSRVYPADLEITLQRIMDAPDRVSYQGVMTRVRRASSGDTLKVTQRVIHQRPDRDRIDIFEPDSLRRTVALRIKDEVYRRESVGDSLFYSHRKQFGPDELDLGLDFSRLDLIKTNYDLSLTSSERFLGRSVSRLTIIPRHPGRLTKIAWVDDQTGLVLRTEDRNPPGALVEEIFFTSLTVNPLIDPGLFETHEWKDRAVEVNQVIACGSFTEVEREAGFTLAAPVYLPPGFTLERLRVIRFKTQPLVHFLYTDGMAQLSLFERKAPHTGASEPTWPDGPPEQRGQIQMWKRGLYTILRRTEHDLLFTAVSDIHEAESLKLIESLCVIQPSESGGLYAGWMLWTGGGLVGLFGVWLMLRKRSSF